MHVVSRFSETPCSQILSYSNYCVFAAVQSGKVKLWVFGVAVGNNTVGGLHSVSMALLIGGRATSDPLSA